MMSKCRYTVVFEFNEPGPRVGVGDEWLSGKVCAVHFEDIMDTVLDCVPSLRPDITTPRLSSPSPDQEQTE